MMWLTDSRVGSAAEGASCGRSCDKASTSSSSAACACSIVIGSSTLSEHNAARGILLAVFCIHNIRGDWNELEGGTYSPRLHARGDRGWNRGRRARATMADETRAGDRAL